MRDGNDHKKGPEKPSLKPFTKAHKRMCKNMYLDPLHKHGYDNNALSRKLSASKPWMLHLKQKCSVAVIMKSSHECHGFLACTFLKLLCSTFD
jgi:hypothetical protein